MKNRLIAVLVATLFATALFAERPVRRTIVVKDGKVVTSDGEVFNFDTELLGGKRAYLGVSLVDISPDLREHYGATKETGALVDSVAEGSPAEKSGLRVGDLIVTVDGKDVRSAGDIRRALAGKKDGDSVRVDIIRNRARQTLVATVMEREGTRHVIGYDLGELGKKLRTDFESPAWKTRIERLGGDCDDLQSRIRDLETRLKDLEKKLK